MAGRKAGNGEGSGVSPKAELDLAPLMAEHEVPEEFENDFEKENANLPGDLDPFFGQQADQTDTDGRKRTKSEWGGTLRAIVADLPPGVGLRFRAWYKMHEEGLRIKGITTIPACFSLYIDMATFNDVLRDELREKESRQYDWDELHIGSLQELLELQQQGLWQKEVQAHSTILKQRVDSFFRDGVISEEALARLKNVIDEIGGDTDG